MPFCPECRYEYVEGVETCPDCGSALVAELAAQQTPEPEPKAGTDDKWVGLLDLGDAVEGSIIADVLESAGIPVWLKSDTTLIVQTAGIPGRPGLVIMVPSSRVEDAKAALEEAREGGRELRWEVWRDGGGF